MLLMLQFNDSLINGVLIIIFLFLACIAVGLGCTGGGSRFEKEEHIPASVRKEIGVESRKRPSPTISWREIPRDPLPKRSIRTKRPIPGVSHAIRKVHRPPGITEKKVKALRGGEFVGNRMRFKVKVVMKHLT